MSCDFYALSMPGIATIAPYVPGKPLEEVAKEYGLSHVIKLASNECPIGCSPKVRQYLQQHADAIFRYPDGDGLALKQALADKHGLGVEHISLGNGSNDLLELVARIFAGPGKDIVFSQYAFAIYALVAQAINARQVEVPAKQWGHDLKAMAQAINENTRVVFIANPNNPTGTWLNKEDMETFLKNVPDHVVVVLDEAYREYVQDDNYPDGIDLLQRFPQLVVTRTFSKVYGMAGLRLGYSFSHPHVADLINRVRQPFNVNGLAQSAGLIALQDQAHVQEAVRINRQGMQQCRQAFESLNLTAIPSYGNFISVDVGDGQAVYTSLLKQGVIVRPMAGYQMPAYIRVTIGTAEENDIFIKALSSTVGARAS